MNIVNLYENYNNYFNADLKSIFQKCSDLAAENNYKIYLIGGIVRDLLLNMQNLDIDITVEGDAIEFVRLLEKAGVAKILSVHEDFGTVKAQINEKNIDFASTRSEIYKKAGHLPTVGEIGCSLQKDVLRRDFTINSLAISLNKDNFGDLIDYVGGFEDLKSKKIRILHDKSFIDDPTRIIRGLKYSTRLGFDLEAETLALQEAYLNNINYDMCYKRIKNELKLTLGLKSNECFKKFINQGIYKLVGDYEVEVPKISVENLVEKYEVKNSWLVYLSMVLIKECKLEILLDKFEFTKKEKIIVLNAKKTLNIELLNTDFEIYKAFEDIELEALLVFAVLRDENIVFRYLDFLKEIKLSVTGDTLLKLGVNPSKKFGEAFDYVLKHKLENPTLTIEEEREFLKEYINSIEM